MGNKRNITLTTLNDLLDNVEKMHKNRSIPIADLFTDDFVSANTEFETLIDFIVASDVDFSTAETFLESADDNFDTFISKNTIFSGWNEMFQAAGEVHYKDKLGDGYDLVSVKTV